MTRGVAPVVPAGDQEVVEIERLAAGGDGVGRLGDGRAVFVPRTAPGDVIQLARVHRQKRFARATVAAVLSAGPGRVTPPCPHYVGDDCGGCQLQHLSPGAQRAARRTIVGDALRRLGGLLVDDPEIEPADREWEYRTRITLHRGRDGRIGFHRHGRAGAVFELEECRVSRPELLTLWEAVRAHRSLLPDDLDALTLRLERGGGRHVLVRGAGEAWPGAGRLAAALREFGITTWWQPAGGAARVLHGQGAFPATVFEQVNPVMGERARAHAVALLGGVDGTAGWDLYAGIGETSRMLARLGARVESVELDRRAVELAGQRDPLPAVRRHAGAVEDVIPLLGPPDFVVTNPPRTGMAGTAVDGLAAARPARCVYISCDPATLARDLRRLGDAFAVRSVRAFDLFPQTAHVETVVLLEAR